MSTRPRFDTALRLTGWIAQRLLRLPPATTRNVTVELDLRIPTDDGQTLLADHWAPAGAGDELPTVVVRTPYGRGGPLGWAYGRLIAERGVHVLLVSTRGTFGSGGGEFRAMRHERADGLATLRWLAERPWAGGGVVLAGASYLGYTQWAIAADAPVRVKAMVPQVTTSRLALSMLRPGRIELETLLGWSVATATQEQKGAALRTLMGASKRTVAAMRTLPLADADKAALGREWAFYQECLNHDQDDPYWADEDFTSSVGKVTVPVSSIAGWYDIFLADQIRDYQALVAAGRTPRLTIGPWAHSNPGGVGAAIEELVRWAVPLARGDEPPRRPPVRLFVMGVNEWRDFSQWPPAGYAPQRWHLLPGGSLGPTALDGEPTSFTYDPNDPTPSVGGAKLEPRGAGAVDNRRLEARADVLTFTSPVVTANLEVIGEVTAEVWLRADRPACDLFVRLCDVDERGRSVNICDDLVKVRPDGVTKVTVALSPTAHVFQRGHRVRVQVSAGAFPRFARNLGGDEPVPTATVPHVTTVDVFHSRAHPSAVLLPVRKA